MTVWPTFVAAVIAAVAAIWAGRSSNLAAKALQEGEHEHRNRTRDEERCRSLHSRFLNEIRGSDLPPISTDKFSDPRNKVIGSLTDVAKNCYERAVRADHAAAELRLFCYGRVSEAADQAVEALRAYGNSILVVVIDMIEDQEPKALLRDQMFSAADAYTDAVATYEKSVRGNSGG
jgi:hypothetical protein